MKSFEVPNLNLDKDEIASLRRIWEYILLFFSKAKPNGTKAPNEKITNHQKASPDDTMETLNGESEIE